MKKLFLIFIIAIMLVSLGFAQNSTAQQDVKPPLLMQQTQASSVPTVIPGTPLPPPPGPGAVPGPPPGPAGIPVVQTIPTATLLENLQQAVATAEKLNNLLVPGKVWTMRAPAGEIEIKGGLLYQGAVVAILHFNAVDGTVLPLGVNPHSYQSSIGIQTIKTNLASVIGRLKILPAAEFIEPEACWSFPLVMGSAIVGHIKVYYDGMHILPDYVANQEMTFYGQ
ncbi:hypothetical protein ACX8XN_09835 [Calditrichota bacterium GD2]